MTDAINDQTQTGGNDARLRAIYGHEAVITTAGLFTLVHLDGADAGTIDERTRTFDIRAYQDDDCPLCLYQREHGGIFVFAGLEPAQEDEEAADGDPSAGEPRPSALVETLAHALDRLDTSADKLISALEPVATAELLRLAVNDVGWLHDRLFDLAWSEDREGRAARLERAFASGLSTIETIAIAHPELGDPCTRASDALVVVRRAFEDD